MPYSFFYKYISRCQNKKNSIRFGFNVSKYNSWTANCALLYENTKYNSISKKLKNITGTLLFRTVFSIKQGQHSFKVIVFFNIGIIWMGTFKFRSTMKILCLNFLPEQNDKGLLNCSLELLKATIFEVQFPLQYILHILLLSK